MRIYCQCDLESDVPCRQSPTQEDLLCDGCRAGACGRVWKIDMTPAEAMIEAAIEDAEPSSRAR